MHPEIADRGSIGLENESVGVVPDADDMLGEVDHQFLCTVGEEPLDFRSLIDLNVPEQHLILHIPNLKLFSRMCNQQMIRQRYLQKIEVDNQGIGLDLEELLPTLDPMKSDGSFITVPNAGIPVIICQVLDDELLPDVDHLVDIPICHVYQLYREFT